MNTVKNRRTSIFEAISDERLRQEHLHGHTRPLADGRDRIPLHLLESMAEYVDASRQNETFASVLIEEVLEVLAALDDASLREELVQVAAVCVARLEASQP